MKLFSPLLGLAVSVSAQNASTTSAPGSCPSLLDPASPFHSFVKPYLNDKEAVMAVKAMPESWQGCIGSLNPIALIPSLTTALTKTQACQEASTVLLSLMTSGSSKPMINMTTGEITSVPPPSLLNVSDTEIRKYCDPLTKSILPCLNEGIISPVFTQFINSNPCCTSMVSDIKAATGEAPDALLSSALKYISNVACTIQTPGFDGAKDQTCAYSWYKSFIQGVTEDDTAPLVTRVANSIQVPNDQGCAAFQGSSFTTTTGAAVTALFTKPTVPGSCVNSADELLTWFRKFPVWSTYSIGSIRPLDLFEDGKCVKGSDVLPYFGNDTKTFKKLGVTREQVAASCFHLSNGGFKTCTFSDKSVNPISSNDATTPAPTPKSSSEIATASMVVSTLAVMSWAY